MIDSSSSFIKSTIPLYHNAVKSIIFKCAEIFMGIFIFKLFSLIAARSNQFTSYLMFTEDYLQRLLYITSRGLSRAGLVVLLFSLLNVVLSLYGTLLWALDAPGYIFETSNATISDYQDQRNANPPYMVPLSMDPEALNDTTKRLPQIVGADLFNPGLNYSLTGQVTNHEPPKIVAPSRYKGVGARVWLDDDGFSVSPDTASMIPLEMEIGNETFPICWVFNTGAAGWNCTFSNVFSTSLIATTTGKPEVHWNDETDIINDSRYIMPSRADNIWLSFGAGGGSAYMNQVFTVTKERIRHTFVQSTFKATMLSPAGVLFDRREVKDFVARTWSNNVTERSDPLIGVIVDDMMGAQSRNLSYQFGGNAASNGNRSVAQSNWGLYTTENKGEKLYSLISISVTNMTLIRSETIAEAPKPFAECGRSNFQNEAFGGKVTRTDCEASALLEGKQAGFLGQVDTAAVMIVHGLGEGRSNISAESLDNESMMAMEEYAETLQDLLIARAYAVSIDESVVEITVDKLMVAMSYLQLYLSCLALFLAIIIWLGLMIFADAHWASSLMANLINTTSEPKKKKPGYMTRLPNVTLQSVGSEKKFLTVNGMTVTLYHPQTPIQQGVVSPAPYTTEAKSYMETVVQNVGYNDAAGREGLLAGYGQVYPNAR
ncbi:hypothetical protein FHETE_5808 [Fusarium heterosporum]|uniref:Uncharacterized protein n=1 Tax=Fusarium heterosporum TaxID=42747 RepID=A0A8H5T7J7_FUSHE|nr:hypothetical protein FHETE_5808 [Fusarium heterosporum]